MITKNYEDAIIQNLEDAGCDRDTVNKFLHAFRKGDQQEECKVLAAHRRLLLDELHKAQKQIDCLDYLIYQLKKSNC